MGWSSAPLRQLMSTLVALLVGAGLMIEPTLAVVDAARARGVDSEEVFGALLTRAAAEAEEANAERDLRAADAWSRPPPPMQLRRLLISRPSKIVIPHSRSW